MLAYEEAIRLYEQALETLEWSGAARADERGEMMIELAEQLALAGDVARARPVLESAALEADRIGDPQLAARAALAQGEVAIMAGTEPAAYMDAVQTSLSFFHEHDDTLHEAHAWRILGMWYSGIGRAVASYEAAERMLACARRARSEALEGRALDLIAWSLVQGPTPVAQAIPRVAQMLEQIRSPFARSQDLAAGPVRV